MTRYEYLSYLIKPLNPKFGCEIGLYFGDTTIHLLKTYPNLFMQIIDPFEHYSGYYDPLCTCDLTAVKKQAFTRLAKYEHRYEWTPNKEIPPTYYDFIFIDGNHARDYVLADIDYAIRYVRPGGIIAGHDWDLPGVGQAISSYPVVREYNTKVWHFYNGSTVPSS